MTNRFAQQNPNWKSSKTQTVKKSRAPKKTFTPDDVDPTAAYAMAVDMAKTIGRKFEVIDIEGDFEFYSAADSYLNAYENAIALQTRRPFDFLSDMAAARARFHSLTWGQVKGILNCLRADVERSERVVPPVVKAANEAALTDGMYKLGETIYKLQYNRATGDGRKLYGKRLVVDASVTPAHVSFEYEAGIPKKLTSANKMTIEEAKAFGALYGTCCVCGRTLTDEESIAAGIGPICAGRF